MSLNATATTGGAGAGALGDSLAKPDGGEGGLEERLGQLAGAFPLIHLDTVPSTTPTREESTRWPGATRRLALRADCAIRPVGPSG
jgi:hypothetical protein